MTEHDRPHDGSHNRPHDRPQHRLGATPTDGATAFRVWAPWARSVEVGIGAGRRPHSLGLDPDDPLAGVWAGTVAGVGDGDDYVYRLDGGDWLPDPASRRQRRGVHGPSTVVDPRTFSWSDDTWRGTPMHGTVLYEMHVGTFTPAGTFDAAIAQLSRLAAIGITAVELMPIAAFPGARNWGYDGVFVSAAQESYGGPAGLARFVDAAHDVGLAVLLDVVYNHFGPEGNVVDRFAPYLTDAYRTPWGEAVNVAGPGSDGTRRTFVESAVGWVQDFHVDGFRLDAVHAIVDPTARPFVAELTAAVHDAGHRNGRRTVVTVESSANDPRIVRTPDRGGWGCDAVWSDGFHHSLRVALTGEQHSHYSGFAGVEDLATAWEHRWVYRGQYSPVFERRHGAPADDVDPEHFVVFSQNHDHAGNTPNGERLLAHTDFGDPRRRLALATILLSPFTPMLFMGDEYGDPAPFPYFVDHGDPDLVQAVRDGRRREFSGLDWSGEVADPADPATFEGAILDPSLARHGTHRALQAMCTQLLRLRRELPVLTVADAHQVVATDGDAVVVRRSHGQVRATIVLNFAGTGHPMPPLDDGDRIAFDSDAPEWGGVAHDASTVNPFSARLTLGGG